MNLFENPIFITQKRLVHRGGVMAAILIAALLGLSLLAGLIAYLSSPISFGFDTSQIAGKVFYGWVIGIEIVVLVMGGFGRISRAIAEDRKAGLWDSNRLTPLPPAQLVLGYWFGAALREFYMSVVLAAAGLFIVLLARLPITLWLGTQLLLAFTALFFGLLGVLMGLAFEKPRGNIFLVVGFFIFQTFSMFQPNLLLTNFLLPVYGIANLFTDASTVSAVVRGFHWDITPEVFGLHLNAVLLSIVLQVVMGIFLWRAAVRKTANPFQPLLQRWEAVAIFAVLVVVQHGLMWGLWKGHFGAGDLPSGFMKYRNNSMLPIVHGGTMFLATIILAFASPLPERVRVEALRLGSGNLALVFSRSAVSLALALAAVSGAALLTQCAAGDSWVAYAIAVANLLEFFLIFSLLLEFCRLAFKQRAMGFIVLWLFVICILPFILAGVFRSEALLRVSLLAPGIGALADPHSDTLNQLVITAAAHFGVVVLLFLMWQNQWQRLLAKASSARPA